MANDPEAPELSVVIPALNEEGALADVLARLKKVLADKTYEILLIDDGSDDETAKIGRENGARVISHPYRKGNGAAIKRGIREALGQAILLMDADGQHPPEEIPRLLDELEGHDMAVGARAKGTGQKAHRWMANRLFSMLASYLAAERIPDLTSGFRVLKAQVAKRYVDLLPNTFSYPSTLTITLARAGYTIAHVPIIADQSKSPSKIRPPADGLRFLYILLKVGVGLAPFRVFFPLSLVLFLLGLGWYVFTYISYQRFTNMSALLLCTAVIIFMLGLIAEQIAQLRRERRDE
ncbi:MAG: glycosyltransferase family 2 protein [Deltaproteobacteria bacterium]|nr:glycosyltransferase family 2 protein [Deltaproteobacteria bacterium]